MQVTGQIWCNCAATNYHRCKGALKNSTFLVWEEWHSLSRMTGKATPFKCLAWLQSRSPSNQPEESALNTCGAGKPWLRRDWVSGLREKGETPCGQRVNDKQRRLRWDATWPAGERQTTTPNPQAGDPVLSDLCWLETTVLRSQAKSSCVRQTEWSGETRLCQ